MANCGCFVRFFWDVAEITSLRRLSVKAFCLVVSLHEQGAGDAGIERGRMGAEKGSGAELAVWVSRLTLRWGKLRWGQALCAVCRWGVASISLALVRQSAVLLYRCWAWRMKLETRSVRLAHRLGRVV